MSHSVRADTKQTEPRISVLVEGINKEGKVSKQPVHKDFHLTMGKKTLSVIQKNTV